MSLDVFDRYGLHVKSKNKIEENYNINDTLATVTVPSPYLLYTVRDISCDI